ncbi:hypothetical protein [Streptomyces sp. 2P-4]|uniref:hypothetical protein n=1 Tax=Streptomyces sp. 2P-4 TaxID=2931974 RepID=UPI0025404861|nr:hypothetical protein [Streptomyces sp. 2P-4]
MPDAETVLLWAGALAGVSGLVAVLVRFARAAARTWERVDQFVDDWYGQPERAGVPARPGVLERVARIEQELCPDEGGSLRAAVDEANRRLARLCPDEPDAGPPAGG